MLYSGHSIQVTIDDDGIARLHFDLEGASVNKFNQATLQELREALQAIYDTLDNTLSNTSGGATKPTKGLLISSGKRTFLVGADITEFADFFAHPRQTFIALNMAINQTFSLLEDLPIPSVALINGIAFGGGFEICLTADYRVMLASALVALPEVKLGLMPGWGGSVRLPRLIGLDKAVQWIAQGSTVTADQALQQGAVDYVVDDANALVTKGKALLQQCIAGELDAAAHKQKKFAGVMQTQQAQKQLMAANASIQDLMQQNYPAPAVAIQTIKQHIGLPRDEAIEIEAEAFATLCLSDVATNLVGVFLADQLRKRQVKKYQKIAHPVTCAAVLGAGIMGGGIAYQSAYKGIPIVMKDLVDDALQLGMDEVQKLLQKQADKGRISSDKMNQVLADIQPTLAYQELSRADVVIEAVIEDATIKAQALVEVEACVLPSTVIASNTSTIAINHLAQSLQDPSRFCGMHFFNPVPKMPLVEVIRGQHTSEVTIATAMAYAHRMGKKTIVVNDCPGFFVNRVLFPYLGGFGLLLEQGLDVGRIDRVMEEFGWPMGPACLVDVIGIDTTHHCQRVLAEGFPMRMAKQGDKVITHLFESRQLGRKNGVGFYRYGKDKEGHLTQVINQTLQDYLVNTYSLKTANINSSCHWSDADIIDALMIPLSLEVARCLYEGIIGSPEEADLALIYGLGFPAFKGGACRLMDKQGISALINKAHALYNHGMGPLYEVPTCLHTMVRQQKYFYSCSEGSMNSP